VSQASSKLVAIESQTLVWGVRKVGPPQQLQRAKWLFDELESDDAQIIVPAIVLSEYLCAVAPDDHSAVVAAITKRFLVLPFDALCASIAAELFQHGNASRAKGAADSRKILRADSLIIATASRHGARLFYSHDKDCRALAKKIDGWEVRDLPTQGPHLFDNDSTSAPTA
jgi:predicted nucleic acid-binding protein